MHTMLEEHFSIHRGEELLSLYDLAAWVPDTEVEWLPVMRAHGGAGGPIVPAAFDSFVTEIVDGLAALVAEGPLDGVYFDLHGAAHVADRDRAEEELLGKIRAVVGPDTVISLSMDTHGNFSQELAEYVDLAVCFRHAPHIDAWAIRERAVKKLIEILKDGRRPLKAWVRVPVLLPGENSSTLVEPAKTVFGAIIPAIEKCGVVDASLWVGFAWADEPRNGAAVMVTGYDEAAITACAEELARGYWDARFGFVIVSDHSGSWEEALDFALTEPAKPLFISDSGDNVTAGSAGDITFALAATLEREDFLASGQKILFAGMTDPDSVRAAEAAGVGQPLKRAIGAIVDSRYGGPVERDWKVEQLIPGLNEGEGVVGAVLSDGNVHAMVQLGRSYFMDPKIIGGMTGRRLTNHAWIPSTGYDVVVVKNGYLFPGQQDEAASWFMAITPGGTDLDFERLHFERVWRPIYPLDKQFEADLTPIIL
jgi:microcystin degradation protein MlrC